MKSIILLSTFMVSLLCSCARVSEKTPGSDLDMSEKVVSDTTEYGDDGRDNGIKLSRKGVNPKPTDSSIICDLTGQTISEGTSDGYFEYNWLYKIERGEISDFNIVKTLFDNDNFYVVEAEMKIYPSQSYYYDVALKISYQKDEKKGWLMDDVTTLGLKVVSNGMYDNSMEFELEKGLYFSARNNSNVTLKVGGRKKPCSDGGIEKFCYTIGAHETISDMFRDYEIDFIIKEI